MPPIRLEQYQEDVRKKTLTDEIIELPKEVQDSILAKLNYLRSNGYKTKEPTVKSLGKGLNELRIVSNRVHYRILFFFYDNGAVLLPGIHKKKQDQLPPQVIRKARDQIKKFKKDPGKYLVKS